MSDRARLHPRWLSWALLGLVVVQGTALWPSSASATPAAEMSAEGEAVPDPDAGDSGATPHQHAPADDARSRAGRAFEEGLRLARAEHYEAAKRQFLHAYALAPHPIVAYNAALACLGLGQERQALALLTLALAEDGGKLSPADRAAIETARDALQKKTSASDDAPPPAPAATPPARDPSTDPPSHFEPVTIRPETTPSPPPSAQRTARSQDRTIGYLVGGSGLALIAAAGALYLWNDERHDDWQREQQALEARQAELIGAGQSPRQDPDWRRRANANNDLLKSIKTVDAVDALLLAGGALGVGIGAYFALFDDRAEVAVRGRQMELRVRF
ncbi:MAG TPA: hypothetical protein VKZ49_00855 [Polyangiaceae bacterium]|nr:hypothetical protein [Polyangiaceae bacterium]